jgi:hypothetical protein
MADSKYSALTAVTTLDGTEEWGVNQAGTSKKVSLALIKSLSNYVPVSVASLASDATANATTTAAKITGLDLVVGPGIYQFQYFIRYVSSVTTTGVKFSVNHTGTLTAFLCNMRYVDAAATASTGAHSQAANASTAHVMGAYSARAKSNTASMGPTLSADSTGDMFMILEGILVVSVSGNIELYHASETAASTTVKAGSSLMLVKVG